MGSLYRLAMVLLNTQCSTTYCRTVANSSRIRNFSFPTLPAFSLTSIAPAMDGAVLDGFAVHVLALVVMEAHWHDGESRSMLAKEEEITSPPPSVGKLDTENFDWKILSHSFCYLYTDEYSRPPQSISVSSGSLANQ